MLLKLCCLDSNSNYDREGTKYRGYVYFLNKLTARNSLTIIVLRIKIPMHSPLLFFD